MLKNEFRLIGTVVEDFKEVGSGSYSKKQFVVEVEKKGNRGTSLCPVVVWEGNRDIDTSVSYVGKVIIVNGYIDCYKTFTTLVAQELFVVKGDEEEAPDIAPLPGIPDDEFPRAENGDRMFDEEKRTVTAEECAKAVAEVSDDDLPF